MERYSSGVCFTCSSSTHCYHTVVFSGYRAAVFHINTFVCLFVTLALKSKCNSSHKLQLIPTASAIALTLLLQFVFMFLIEA